MADRSATETIILETVPLGREHASALDKLIRRVQKDSRFSVSRALLIRCLVRCLDHLPIRTQGIDSERAMQKAILQAVDALQTGKM